MIFGGNRVVIERLEIYLDCRFRNSVLMLFFLAVPVANLDRL